MEKDKELREIIDKQQEKIKQYKARLGDIVTAYKGLAKEKEALEASLKALSGRPKTAKKTTVKGKKENATDSEKQKDEEITESKALREIETLSESLTTLSVEKSRLEASFQADRKRLMVEKDELEVSVKELTEKLFFERQQRGTEQNNYGKMIRRWEEAESEWRLLVASQEERIRSLESRVTLLSESLAAQHALHQRDYGAMQVLKERMTELSLEHMGLHKTPSLVKETSPLEEDNNSKQIVKLPPELAPLDLSTEINTSSEGTDNPVVEIPKDQLISKEKSVTALGEEEKKNTGASEKEYHNLQGKLKELSNRLLQEEDKLRRAEQGISEAVRQEREHWERCLESATSEFRLKTSHLEGEMLRQRQRSLALLDEKDAEIARLRASIEFNDTFPAKGSAHSSAMADGSTMGRENRLVGPPLLHHAHEAARLELELREVRAERRILETQLHDARRENTLLEEERKNEVAALKDEVDRLQWCQSREGSHLEYLKNVVLSYLLTTRESRRCHMLSAIAAVLRFTPDECSRVSKLHRFSTQ
ncbi:GRIP and coiled-coil domain-containing protein 1 [Hetaerina americana]|uniref:GRIP and coiled-coil domain-containing protein 1 n=1 Tax=Hetaerina americana TaxID=62018 RepID=UPI003A7F38BC